MAHGVGYTPSLSYTLDDTDLDFSPLLGLTIPVQVIVLVKVNALIMAHASVTLDGMVNCVTFLLVRTTVPPVVIVISIHYHALVCQTLEVCLCSILGCYTFNVL